MPRDLADRRAAALARVEERVRAAVESAPPLPAEVSDRFAALVRAAMARRSDRTERAA